LLLVDPPFYLVFLSYLSSSYFYPPTVCLK
jgi:hypothetical protein